MSKKLYDPLRKIDVTDTPEERVRLSLVRRMVEQLGYPPSLIAVEKALPGRRFDVLVYAKMESDLRPLLLMECKAVPITQATLDQVIGYNYHVQAPYIAVANADEVRCGWFNGDAYCFIDAMPEYDALIATI